MYLKIERPTVFISRTPSPPRLPRPRRINFRVRQRRRIPYICQCRVNFRTRRLRRCTQPFQPWQHPQRRRCTPIPQKQPLPLCDVAAISYAVVPLRFLHSFRSPNFYHFHVSQRSLLFLRFLYSPRPPNFSVPSVFHVSPDVTIPSSSFEEKSFLK